MLREYHSAENLVKKHREFIERSSKSTNLFDYASKILIKTYLERWFQMSMERFTDEGIEAYMLCKFTVDVLTAGEKFWLIPNLKPVDLYFDDDGFGYRKAQEASNKEVKDASNFQEAFNNEKLIVANKMSPLISAIEARIIEALKIQLQPLADAINERSK